METLVLERKGRLFLTGQARVITSTDQVSDDVASELEWEIDGGSPFVKWISGSYAQSGEPNQNKQFWTAGDLAMGEYSIRYAPLNIVHRVRQPVGFYLSTRKVFLEKDQAEESDFRIEALAGMWSHVFPFESSLVDQADEKGLLYFSMECRGETVTCSGDSGCGETFDYMAKDDHCSHLKERSSIRHIGSPTFRGGALIIPPIRPGWQEAHATVFEDAVRQEAAKYAEETESYYEAAKMHSDVTPESWEYLMAAIVSTAKL